MPALDFPANPTNGQAYANWIYSTSKGAWQAKPMTNKVTTSGVAPASPSNGDEWYNTEDGNIYVYYNDGNSEQWVQVKSDATLSSTLGNRVSVLESLPSGLIPIVPSSVTLGSGTATVDSTGTVTFTGATSVMLNGVFNTQYNNYLQVCSFNTSATLEVRQRLSHSGSALTGAAYGWGGISVTSAGTPSYYSGSGIDWYPIGSTQAATSHAFSQTIHYPMDSGKITRTTFSGGVWDGAWRSINFSGAYNATSLASGIQMYSTSANTISGEMMIFGYR